MLFLSHRTDGGTLEVLEINTGHLNTHILNTISVVIFDRYGLIGVKICHCFVHGSFDASTLFFYMLRKISLLAIMLLMVLSHASMLFMARMRLHVSIVLVLHLR